MDEVDNPATITLAGTIVNGNVDHGATMDFNSGIVGSPPVNFASGGTISLPDPADRITGSGTTGLSNVDNSILGIGTIDQHSDLSIGAGATVEASGGTLVIEGKLINTGTLGKQDTVVFGGPGAGFNNGKLAAGSTVDIGALGAPSTD